MRNTLDYYELLGVTANSSSKEIKKAYLEKAKKFHPDSPNGNDLLFKQLSEAYETLSNENKKQQYDNSRKKSTTQSPGSAQAKYHRPHRTYNSQGWSGGSFKQKTQEKDYKDEQVTPLEVVFQMFAYGLMATSLVYGVYTIYSLYTAFNKNLIRPIPTQPITADIRLPERRKVDEGHTEEEVKAKVTRNKFKDN